MGFRRDPSFPSQVVLSLDQIKAEHEAGLIDLRRSFDFEKRRQKDLLQARLKAKRAKRESEKGGMSESVQDLLAKEEEEEESEVEARMTTEKAKVEEKHLGILNSTLSQARTEETNSNR